MLPVILCLDMGAYDYLYYRVQNGDRGRWQEACRVLQRIAGQTPIAVCTTHEPVLMYYLRPNNYRDAENMRPEFGTRVYSLEKGDVYQIGEGGQPGNGFNYMREAIRKAREEGRELFVAAVMPELREKDPDGTVRQALRRDFELIAVRPCWVGPKDETVYVWQVRR
jgi:hypothetical protein